VRAQVRQLHETLSAEPCPPGTTGTAFTGLRNFHIGAGFSAVNGVNVENGNLGGKQSVAGPSFEVGLEWYRTIKARLFGLEGSSRVDRGGVGGIQPQPNGNIQNLSATGVASSVATEIRISRFGGEVEFGPRAATVAELASVVPFAGLGYEHARFVSNLIGTWNSLAFSFRDQHRITTNRGYGYLGAEYGLGTLGILDFVLRARGQGNVDVVNGNFTYESQQFGVPLGPPATGAASKTGLTFSGELGLGASRTFPNGLRLRTYTWVGFVPWWEGEYRNGQPVTLENDYKVNAGANFRLEMPWEPHRF
jgi:hypothetical protein